MKCKYCCLDLQSIKSRVPGSGSADQYRPDYIQECQGFSAHAKEGLAFTQTFILSDARPHHLLNYNYCRTELQSRTSLHINDLFVRN